MVNPYRYVRTCAWSGPILLFIALVFWAVIGHNIPPFSADLDAETFAAQFREHALSIRIGMIATMVGGVLYMTWGVAISKIMQALERDNDVLSTLQRWGAGLTALIFVIPCGIWTTATFRAQTMNPEMLQMLYDLGWVIFDVSFSLTTVQMVALGVCFLGDTRSKPLFPKWVAWFSIWVGLMFFLETLMPFFKSGPFSRSGTLNYWIEFSIFFWFMGIVSYYTFTSITRLEQEHVARPQPV